MHICLSQILLACFTFRLQKPKFEIKLLDWICLKLWSWILLSPCLCPRACANSGKPRAVSEARFRSAIWLGCTELLPGMQPWQVAKPFLVISNVTVTRTTSYQLWALIAKTSVSTSTWFFCAAFHYAVVWSIKEQAQSIAAHMSLFT